MSCFQSHCDRVAVIFSNASYTDISEKKKVLVTAIWDFGLEEIRKILRMMLGRLIVISVLWKFSFACMNNCSCTPDNKGRNAVVCKDGGIVGPLTLEGMDPNTEVLIITAPEYDMNVLTMVPTFESFKQLEEIHITRSNIPQLGEHFFFYLGNLSVLNLSQNNITQVIKKNFHGLEKLKELILDDNRINSLPSGTFTYLKELKVLSIQRNRLNELMHSVFQEVRKLRVLKLNGNPIRHFPIEAFRDVLELRTLECRGCALSDMNKQIYPLLPHLNHLDLGDNFITRLEKQDFQSLLSLKHLKLDGNKLKHVGDHVFTHLSEMKKLNLARNEIKSIALSAFDNADNLTELDLSFNRINALKPHLFDSIRENLLVLSLSGNPLELEVMKNLFRDSKLRELKLKKCKLFDISEDIFPSTLSSLDLSENYLSGLSGYVIPDNLYFLDISKNRFRGISNDDFLDKIEVINVTLLDRNPWSCDLCFIIPMMNRMNRTSAFRNIVCSQPYVVEGKRLESLDRNQLTWCSSSSYARGDANFFSINENNSIGLVAAGMSVCLLFLILLIISGMFCYSKRHAAKYYTHEDKLAVDNDLIPENHSPLFCEDRELSFKFPLDNVNEKTVSIATIDGMKRNHKIMN